jgi:hypothetical protein
MSYVSLIDPVSQVRGRSGTAVKRNNTTPASTAVNADENSSNNQQAISTTGAANKSGEHQTTLAIEKENKEHSSVGAGAGDEYNEREDNLSSELVKSSSTIGYKKGILLC